MFALIRQGGGGQKLRCPRHFLEGQLCLTSAAVTFALFVVLLPTVMCDCRRHKPGSPSPRPLLWSFDF